MPQGHTVPCSGKRAPRPVRPATSHRAAGTARCGCREPTPRRPSPAPPARLPDQPGESDPPSAEEWDAPSDLPAADPIPSIDDFDVDELGCPNLGLVPIGGYNEDPNSTYSYLYTYFRALAPAEWDSPELVCGHPLEPWRDLVIQRLVAGGANAGTIIIAADGTSIPMRLSAPEWTTYKFRYGGSATGINLIG